MAGGGKTATSTSQVKIPPEVLARYNAVNAQAQQVAQQPFSPYSVNPNAFVAPLTPTQQAGIYNTNVAAGMAQPYFQQATGALGAGLQAGVPMAMAGAMPVNPSGITGQAIGQYMSPYLGSVVGTTMAAQEQQNAQQRAAMQGQAIQQGAFGGDRAGIAQANLAYQQNLANAQTLSNLLNQGYGQALQTAVQQQGVGLSAEQANRAALQQQAQNLYGMFGGYGQALAGLGTGAQAAGLQGAQAQLAAGQAQQQTGQAGLAALYNQFLQQQSYPFQVAQFLANIAEGTGALSGSTTTTTQPMPFFSDRRLKHDVHQIGKTNDGLPIYAFKYNGDNRTQIGLMAQDVEKKHPEAVGLAGGYKTVDYEKATEGAHKAYGGGLSSMGGAVGPEHAGLGFERGGYLGGGLVPSADIKDILRQQQLMFANTPWGQAGRPMGGMPGGGSGINFPAGVKPASLAIAKPPTQAPQSLGQQMQSAAQGVESGEKLLKAGRDLYGWGKENIWGQNPATEAAQKFDKMSPEEFGASVLRPPRNPVTDQPAPTNNQSQPPPAPTDTTPSTEYRGGLVRARRADGGESDLPYSSANKSAEKLDIPEESPHAKLIPASPAPGGGSSGGGLGSALTGAAGLIGAGKTLASAASGIADFLAPIFLKDGGLVPRHGYATDGEVDDDQTTLDPSKLYKRAISQGIDPIGAGLNVMGTAGLLTFLPLAFRASGGLVPRHGYLEGGAPNDDQAPPSQDQAPPSPAMDFYNRYLPFAQKVSEETGIHPNVVLAHSALETGYGKHAPGNNFFGIKGPGQSLKTTEYIDGQFVPNQTASFRAYESPEASFADYAKFLKENPRYRELLATRDPAEQIAAIGRSGYAGKNPIYASSILNIAQKFPGGLGETSTPEGGRPAATPSGAPRRQDGGLSPAQGGESPARQDAGLAGPQANISLMDAGVPSMGGGLGAMRGVVREAREPTWLERHRDWLFPLASGIGSMLMSPSIRLGGALGSGLVGAVQGATKAQELEQAQQQRDVAQQQQNVGAYRAYIEGEVQKHAMAIGAYHPRLGYITYDQNGNLVPMKFSDYMARVRAGNQPRLVPDGANKLLQSGLMAPPSGAAPAPVAPQAPAPAGTQPAPQTAPGAAPSAAPTGAAPRVTPTGTTTAEQQIPLWRGLTPDLRQKAEDAADRSMTVMEQRGGADVPAPEDPVRNPFGLIQQMRTASETGRTNRISLMGALNEAASKGATGQYTQQVAEPLVNMANSLLRFYGASENQLFDPTKYGALGEARKLGAQLAANQQLMQGSRAYSELATFLQNTPNPAMDPNGMRRVMAGVMVEQQRAKDLGDFAQHWRDEVTNRSESPVAYTYTGDGLQSAFDSRHTSEQYEKDKNNLARIMASNVPVPDPSAPNGRRMENLGSYIAKNGLAGVRGPLSRMYGPEILRYFGG